MVACARAGDQSRRFFESPHERVYRGLHEKIGRSRISRFIEEVVRPHMTHEDLDVAYKQMSKEERREEEALKWIEGLIGDVSSKPR